MNMVYETKYHAEGSIPPRYREYHSGQGVHGVERQVRLDIESSVIQEDSDIGHSDNRLVCVSSNDAITPIFQLETRPPSSCNRCSHSELIRDDSVYQPSWCLLGRVLAKRQQHNSVELLLIAPV